MANSNKKPKVFEDKTSVVSSNTLQMRLTEVVNTPPALVLLMGPAHMVGKQWMLTKSNTIIGRIIESNIFIEDRSLSKRHLSLLKTEKGVAILDHKSTNGTELNGEIIPPNKAILLKNNDHIKCGNLIFKYLAKGNIESVTNKDTYDRTQMDPLTWIYNKEALSNTGKEVFNRAKLTETALTCIVFDLDNFKSVNDTHGHSVGDFVLKEMANVILNTLIRPGDFFARFGGEEFCIILVATPLTQGVEIAERIRQTISCHTFNYNKSIDLNVTLSLGVASLSKDISSWSELFKKADQASYVSKKSGKNKVSSIK